MSLIVDDEPTPEVKEPQHVPELSALLKLVEDLRGTLEKIASKELHDPNANKEVLGALENISKALINLKPKPIDFSEISRVNRTLVSALEEMRKQNAELIKLLSVKPDDQGTKDLVSALEKNNAALISKLQTVDYSELLKGVMTQLVNRATGWEFTVNRTNTGKITKVTATPIK